jgi:hypothetical protein
MLCTYALGGESSIQQKIFTCLTCFSSNKNEVLCCEACIDQCHVGHNKKFMAYGPFSCECAHYGINCKIIEASQAETALLMSSVTSSMKDQLSFQDQEPFSNVLGVHDSIILSGINGENESAKLLKECESLLITTDDEKNIIKNSSISRVRYWVASGQASRCVFESMALEIFTYHLSRLGIEPTERSGVEWWVDIRFPSSSTPQSKNNKAANSKWGDCRMHYDIDDIVYNKFNTILHPFLCTETHFTEFHELPATIIFNKSIKTYKNQDVDIDTDCIDSCTVVHPRLGRHVCFNGDLLHGTSSDLACRKPYGPQQMFFGSDADYILQTVTFHVNIWLYHKPIGLNPIPLTVINKCNFSDLLIDLNLNKSNSSTLKHVNLTNDAIVNRKKGKGEDENIKSVRLPCLLEEKEHEQEQEQEQDEDEDKDNEDGRTSIMMWYPPECSGEIGTIYQIHFRDKECAAFVIKE